MNPAFWVIHSDLPREGPGTAEDVAWACDAAGVGPGAALCDAACGSGGDVPALLDVSPRVTAFDLHLPFVATVAARYGAAEGLRLVQGTLVPDETGLPDLVALGPFDLIWCAGAVYFAGIAAVLDRWLGALDPGGAVAFSHPVIFQTGDAEAAEMFEGLPVGDEAALDAEIAAAGWSVTAGRRVSEAGWTAYYDGIEARCAMLARIQAPELAAAIAAARADADAWRRLKDRAGYALRVVRPA
ncbi:MAG: methyltransferase domain-containing protein [Pseudomonadota bacterium]